jgi:hypothetical protein
VTPLPLGSHLSFSERLIIIAGEAAWHNAKSRAESVKIFVKVLMGLKSVFGIINLS